MAERDAIERILQELTLPGGFDSAERRIAEIAPRLQFVLEAALHAGGWFDDAFEGAVLKAATTPDGQARIDALRAFAHEQTRLGMLVGVAVGWEIAERLGAECSEDDSAPPDQRDQAGEL